MAGVFTLGERKHGAGEGGRTTTQVTARKGKGPPTGTITGSRRGRDGPVLGGSLSPHSNEETLRDLLWNGRHLSLAL